MTDTFSGLLTACTQLNKIYQNDIIMSKGVFIWDNKESLSIVTFKEKVEKKLIPLLGLTLRVNPLHVVFMDKYFEFSEMKYSLDKVEVIFKGPLSSNALDDKNIESILPHVTKYEEDYLKIDIPFIDISDDEEYKSIHKLLTNIGNSVDYESSTYIEEVDNSSIIKGVRPIELNQDGYFVRLHKSAFQSVASKDIVSVRGSSYKDNTNIFLCTTTVRKGDCQLINVFNVLRI